MRSRLHDFARAVDDAIVEWRLDQAVAATFPASDPIAVSCLAEHASLGPSREALAVCAELISIARRMR